MIKELWLSPVDNFEIDTAAVVSDLGDAWHGVLHLKVNILFSDGSDLTNV